MFSDVLVCFVVFGFEYMSSTNFYRCRLCQRKAPFDSILMSVMKYSCVLFLITSEILITQKIKQLVNCERIFQKRMTFASNHAALHVHMLDISAWLCVKLCAINPLGLRKRQTGYQFTESLNNFSCTRCAMRINLFKHQCKHTAKTLFALSSGDCVLFHKILYWILIVSISEKLFDRVRGFHRERET